MLLLLLCIRLVLLVDNQIDVVVDHDIDLLLLTALIRWAGLCGRLTFGRRLLGLC